MKNPKIDQLYISRIMPRKKEKKKNADFPTIWGFKEHTPPF